MTSELDLFQGTESDESQLVGRGAETNECQQQWSSSQWSRVCTTVPAGGFCAHPPLHYILHCKPALAT